MLWMQERERHIIATSFWCSFWFCYDNPKSTRFYPLKCTTMCNTYILSPPPPTYSSVPSVCSIVLLQCLILVNGLCILLSDGVCVSHLRVRMFVKWNKTNEEFVSFPFCPCGLPQFECVRETMSCLPSVCVCACNICRVFTCVWAC